VAGTALVRFADDADVVVCSTKETFVDGWVRTGDEVYITAESEVFVVDRLKVLQQPKPPASASNELATGNHEGPGVSGRPG
jgi:4-coumarate--CoA ligase